MLRNRVAIVGRPNVGKSTLFNVITETRKAVVKNQPGVTRDIQIEPAEWCGIQFDIIDTGGITESKDTFSPMIREAVLDIIGTVHALIIVMDARSGVCPEDRDLLRIAYESEKPFIVVLNKVDSPEQIEMAKAEFYELGIDPTPCAFEKRWGVDLILDWVVEHFPKEERVEKKDSVTLAIIGKPNSGKSSLVNKLLGENRMLVSEVAGTTVDAIDSELLHHGKQYTIIDTAGIRRRSRQQDGVEVLASFKSLDSIRRANIVLLVVDGTVGPADQDAKLVEAILEKNKSVIIIANKVDVDKPEFRKTFREQAEKVFHFFEDIPIVFTSALTGSGLQDVFRKIDEVWEKLNVDISTRELNDFFFDVIRLAPAPVYGTRDVKFYYLVQTHQVPPSFIAFVNYPDGVDNAYRRFLSKRIKERWNLEGIPIKIYAMRRGGRALSSSEKSENYQAEDRA
jgi:GTP-binding protein